MTRFEMFLWLSEKKIDFLFAYNSFYALIILDDSSVIKYNLDYFNYIWGHYRLSTLKILVK